MDRQQATPRARPGPLTHFMNLLAGADEDTLLSCHQQDNDNVHAIALLMITVWVYQTALFSIVTHRMLNDDGALHPELIVVSAFIASMIAMIDSYMVMRSGWHLHGIAELKRGGLDISGGWGPELRNGIFLGLRILMSVAIAQLTAIFVSLILFHPDIAAEIERVYRTQNADLIAAVQTQVDGDIQRVTREVDDQGQRVALLNGQLADMRQGTVDPAANDAEIKAAQAEVTRLSDDKAKRDAELSAAQTFASNEIAGIKGDPANSGKPGNGPVRRGAQERVAAAQSADAAATQSLAEARSRLDTLRADFASQAPDRMRQAKEELPALADMFGSENARLETLRAQLNALVQDRANAIRRGVEGAPNHVGHDDGLLGQIAALRAIAQSPEIAAVIALIDFTSFSLELAAVLAKVTSFVPTTFSAMLARDAYMRTVRIVDEMAEKLGGRNGAGATEAEFLPPEDGVPSVVEEEGPANDNPGATSDVTTGDPPENGSEAGTEPPKRPRGRPRKSALN